MSNQASGLSYAVRISVLAKYFGRFCFVIAALALVPLGFSLLIGEDLASLGYSSVIVLLAAFGLLLSRIRASQQIQDNEAMVLAALLFLFTPALMSFPMVASGSGFFDAYFEAVSAVTTTGLSVAAKGEYTSLALIFGRAWMRWYGGLGIVIFSLALIVRSGVVAKNLATMETKEEDLAGSTKAYARRVLKVYCILTALAVLVLAILGMDLFAAVIYSFGAISTGGFSPDDWGLAGLGEWPIRAVVILFCIAGATPLTVYYPSRRRQGSNINILQLLSLLASGIITGLLLIFGLRWISGMDWTIILHHVPFLAFSAQTTAGFQTMELAPLDAGSKLVLIISMAIGGGIGSTAGGFKVLRLLIAVQLLRTVVLRTSLARHAVVEPRLEGQRLPEDEIRNALLVVLLFVSVILFSWLPFLAMGYAPIDALFEVVSATGTVGLTVGITRPDLPLFLKGILCLDMLLGRLEIMAWIVLINRRTWIGRRFIQS